MLRLRKYIVLFFVVILFAVSGLFDCHSQRNINKNADVSISITDKEWIAIEVDNEKIELSEASQFPRLKLSAGKVSGFSSCNRMQGTYTLGKEKISFGPIAVTKMLCFETQNIEAKYLKAISEVRFWKYEQHKLSFLNDKKQTILVFEEKE